MPKKGDRRWTDDQLRAAVATSTSYAEVLRKLGLSPRGRNYVRIRDQIASLGLDTSLFAGPRVPMVFDAQLREVVPQCTSYIMVTERLGMERTEANAVWIQRRIGRLGIATTHFLRRRDHSGRASRWSDDDLRRAVSASHGYAATLRALGLVPAGGNYDRLQRRIRELALDTSHFTGSGWSKGRPLPRPARPLDEVLVAGQWTASHQLKKRLLREGLKARRCELCGWAEQRSCDGVIPVELDHVNGDKADNRIENLRILCPNCHALQPTHRGLNQKRRKKS